ncbi:type I restriction enzyme S subunit [Flavobacterium sp. 270]|uniref:restriction endonuclease subunit S n=1 Tax=Flavobacterium sp. 270 TaxID=2512114 RepID=UPI001066FEE0|nr:restriction endonuclease subunit S [Flavobacterium sp. 270]TDW51575.1 type I restriction enzyme S subunit [Flavobacterium sp. 270]
MSWKKVKLGHFLKNREGRYKPNDIAIQGLKRIDKINFSGTIFLSDKPSNTDMILVKKGDLVISGINVEKGAMNIYQGDEDVVATIHYSSYHFDEKQIDINFLTNFLKSLEFKKALKDQVPGGIKTEIKPKHILPLLVEIPTDVKEQKKIVTKLISNNSNVQNINSELNHQLHLIKQLRKAFLREAMQGKLIKSINTSETGQQLLAKIKAKKAKIIAEKKLKKEKELSLIKEEDIPFEIPKHWAWCRLGDTGNLKRGKSKHRPRNDQELFVGGNIPFIQTGDVSKAKNNNNLITTVNGYYNDFGLKQSELQKKGTLCITIAANIAECGFLDFDACLPDSIVCFLSIDKIIEKYIYYYLVTAKDELERYAPATAQKNINLGILNDLKIPFPPIHEQEQIVAKLGELMAFCDGLEQSIKESQGYNEMLLQQVLREALQPNQKINDISIESKKIESPLKTILAGHIINLNNTTDFGRVKFQKLLFLTEYICKIDFDSNYIKKVAGPYDDFLIKSIEADFNRMRFFNVVQDKTDNKRVRYTALAGANELESLFLENFADESLKINNTLLKFRPLSWGECELIATLYAVWNNRIIKNEQITDELLYSDFMAWDKQKSKYHSVFHKWLFWMKEERIIPDGWGKYIDKPQ